MSRNQSIKLYGSNGVYSRSGGDFWTTGIVLAISLGWRAVGDCQFQVSNLPTVYHRSCSRFRVSDRGFCDRRRAHLRSSLTKETNRSGAKENSISKHKTADAGKRATKLALDRRSNRRAGGRERCALSRIHRLSTWLLRLRSQQASWKDWRAGDRSIRRQRRLRLVPQSGDGWVAQVSTP